MTSVEHRLALVAGASANVSILDGDAALLGSGYNGLLRAEGRMSAPRAVEGEGTTVVWHQLAGASAKVGVLDGDDIVLG